VKSRILTRSPGNGKLMHGFLMSHELVHVS